MAANCKDNAANVFNSVSKIEIDSIVEKIMKISSKIKVKESKLLHVKLKEDGFKTWTGPEVPKEHLGRNKAENAPSTYRNNDEGEIFNGTKTWTNALESRFEVPKETNL